MGWESDVTAASSLLTANSKFEDANSKNKAIATEAEYQEGNIANAALRKAGTLQTSFLQSGIALDPNTAVNSVIQQALDQGKTDIARVNSNANATISNNNSAARMAALSGLGASALKIFNPNTGTPTSYGANWLGQEVGGALDPSPVGPYQSPF